MARVIINDNINGLLNFCHVPDTVIFFTCSSPNPHTLRSGYDYHPKLTDEETEARVTCSRSHGYEVANLGCKP